MSEPVIAAKQPAVLEFQPGTYYWCRCGKSKQQPWCDGSHAGSGFSPLEMKVDQAKRAALCQCKHTQRPPFCDGTHRTLA